MTTIGRFFAFAGLSVVLVLVGCGSEDAVADDGALSAGQSAPTADTGATVQPTGTVIEVRMVTDGVGNYFEPAEVTAKPGDVVRFVLVSGVHNVSFPAATNAGAGSLPEMSPYLQLPGQTHDLLVELSAGSYAFQCDPHAALGMVGTLKVQ